MGRNRKIQRAWRSGRSSFPSATDGNSPPISRFGPTPTKSPAPERSSPAIPHSRTAIMAAAAAKRAPRWRYRLSLQGPRKDLGRKPSTGQTATCGSALDGRKPTLPSLRLSRIRPGVSPREEITPEELMTTRRFPDIDDLAGPRCSPTPDLRRKERQERVAFVRRGAV